MKYGRMAAAASLAACVLLGSWGSCEAVDKAAAETVQHVQADCSYEHDGYRLRMPQEFDKLLLTETKFQEGNRLFSVSEKASIAAAQKEYADYSGAGWLFAISKVSEAELQQMLCEDMSGRTLFARDDKGSYYIFEHPTDVRYMRETPATMQRDQEQWSHLCAWAWSSVRKDFIEDNPGLSPMTADNSNIGIYLANVSYRPDMKYSLGKKDGAALPGEGVRALPFGEKLIYGNTYEMVKGNMHPRGDYVKLSLPKENTELYFFRRKGENYVLEKRKGLHNNLYKAIPVEEHAEAMTVMQEWYDTVAAKARKG